MKKLITIAAFGFSSIALAQGAAPAFEELDADMDGQISREEAAVVEGLDFATADVDQDGYLTPEEYADATQ